MNKLNSISFNLRIYTKTTIKKIAHRSSILFYTIFVVFFFLLAACATEYQNIFLNLMHSMGIICVTAFHFHFFVIDGDLECFYMLIFDKLNWNYWAFHLFIIFFSLRNISELFFGHCFQFWNIISKNIRGDMRGCYILINVFLF